MPSVNVFGYGDTAEDAAHAPDYSAPPIGTDYGALSLSPQRLYGERDGTEFIVGGIVLLALGILFGFVQAGFRAVITTGR
jgi:hypothetical protein